MTAQDILDEIQPLGRDSYKKVLANHGVPEPVFGVKIEELKKIQKRIKKDYQLALDLYDTGVYDAMYLAGLIADDMAMTRADLRKWAKDAPCTAIAEYTVAWVASSGKFGWELALDWIDSKKQHIAVAGWATLASLVAIKDDGDLNLQELKGLLGRVEKTIHEQPDRVRYTMNSFVISVGGYVAELSDLARRTGEMIGPVTVDMGDTSCKVPFAPEYIDKMKKRGTLGKKRKSAKC